MNRYELLNPIFRKTEAQRTPREAVVYVMEHSRAGALVQAFIRHALDQTHPEKQACECRGEEVNTDMLLRLLEADRLLGRDSVVDGLRKYTEAVIARGLDGLRKDFGDMAGMVNPDAWMRCAEDVKHALDLAAEDAPHAERKPLADRLGMIANAAFAVVDADSYTDKDRATGKLAHVLDVCFDEREDEDEEVEA
jgi:hypothetical protein